MRPPRLLRRPLWTAATLLAASLSPRSGHADDQLAALKDKARAARSAGQLDQEAVYLCQAAALDARHFDKRCADARAEAAREAQAFDGYLDTAKFELTHRDFPGAIRDLSKITFGPRHAEAQHLLQQAQAIQAAGGPDAVSQAALRRAQAFYAAGNFPAAVEAAGGVITQALAPAARQLVTNIQIYRDTMATADQLSSAGHPREAAEKYSFALSITSNGPGDPAGKLQRMKTLVAEQQRQAAAAAEAHAASAQAAPTLSPELAAREKNLLARARHAERTGDLRAALAGYNDVLGIDKTQPDADAGRTRMQAALARQPSDPQLLLVNGIRGFYGSRFAAAAEAIASFLTAEHTRDQGAAHFYLGASLLAQALLDGPTADATPGTTDLRQSAAQQFHLAHDAGYKPVQSAVSPRILSAWNQAAHEVGSE